MLSPVSKEEFLRELPELAGDEFSENDKFFLAGTFGAVKDEKTGTVRFFGEPDENLISERSILMNLQPDVSKRLYYPERFKEVWEYREEYEKEKVKSRVSTAVFVAVFIVIPLLISFVLAPLAMGGK